MRIIKATFTAALLPALVLLFSVQASQAGSATWNLNPASGDWNTAANWRPATVPNGPADTATFDISNTTFLETFLGPWTEVNGIVFNAGASAFTITLYSGHEFTHSGVGITNNSGITQSFVNTAEPGNGGSGILFTNSATAGSLTVFINNGNQESESTTGGFVEFLGTSTADNGTFTNDGAPCDFCGGGATFFRHVDRGRYP